MYLLKRAVVKLSDIKWKLSFLIIAGMSQLSKMTVYAAPTPTPTPNAFANDYDFLVNGESNHTFDTLTTTVKQTGTSLYGLLRTLGIVAIMIAVSLAGTGIAMTKNANRRSESKEWMLYVCLGGALIFGVTGIIALIASIGTRIG